MTFDEKILVFENKIIDFLTMITWWTEVRFNKDNIILAANNSALASLCLFFAIALDIPEIINKGMYGLLFILGTLAFLLMGVFCLKVFGISMFVISLKRYNPQGTPNPCRVSGKHSLKRRYTVFLFIFLTLLLKKDLSNIFFIVAFFLDALTEFLVACDSLPPQEKMRRKIASEEAAGSMQPSMNM